MFNVPNYRNEMKYNFEKLEVHAIAEKLVIEVYQLLKKLPESELFGLTSQIKRSVISIVLNVAEGATGRSKKDFIRYLITAIGSLSETKAGSLLAVKLGYLDSANIEDTAPLIDELFFKLNALKKSLHEK